MRQVIDDLPASKIRDVANAAIGRDDVLAFWFGESDEPTPAFIRDAATHSIAEGETFYSHNLGLPELRAAISRYVGSLHPAVGVDRIAVTSSGVNALMLTMQALAGAGDEVVAVVPVWPNLTAQPAILGARVVRHPLQFKNGRWDTRHRRAAPRRHVANARAARQLAQQSDRLDPHPSRAARDPGPLPQHRHLDRRRRGLRTHPTSMQPCAAPPASSISPSPRTSSSSCRASRRAS